MVKKDISLNKNKTIVDSFIFRDFSEYYHYIRHLSSSQKEKILSSLSRREAKNLENSFRLGGWEDLLIRNDLDKKVSNFKKKYNFDLLNSRIKVMSKKSVYLDKIIWEEIIKEISEFEDKHSSYLIGGIDAVNIDPKTVLLIKKGTQVNKN
jgi:hypothetical protein